MRNENKDVLQRFVSSKLKVQSSKYLGHSSEDFNEFMLEYKKIRRVLTLSDC